MRKAIVTGGTRGIGRAIAHALLSEGAHVMITGREVGAVRAAVAELAAETGRADRILGEAVDVRDRQGIEQLVSDATRKFDGLDTLINNAGVGAFADVAAMTDEDWSRVIDTNLTGVFYCSRAVIPAMTAGGGGWIISIASLAGRNFFPGGGAYCASKAGLVAFSEALMQEVRAQGIRVSVVMPGSVATGFSGPGKGEEDSWKLTPADIAEVVTDLLRHPTRSLPSKIEIRPARTR